MNDNIYDMEYVGEFNCVVIKYNVEKGFGFVRPTDGKLRDDAFVHYSQIDTDKPGFKKLFTNQNVLCKIYLGQRGYTAKDIQTLEAAVPVEDGNH